MKLSKLIQNLPIIDKRYYQDQEISGIAFNSKNVLPGFLFVAIPGTHVDGHSFIEDALEKGAVALVVEREVHPSKKIPIFKIENSRAGLSLLSSHWFGNSGEDLEITGITGTNGKTTITFLLEAMLKNAGFHAGRIGTIGYHFKGNNQKLEHTTPESYNLHQILREMRDHKVDKISMEVSSHAVAMHRVDHIPFTLAIFTNLSPEHLDYHKSMELYFEAKKKLFTQLLPRGKGLKRAILNADDAYGLRLLDILPKENTWTFSTRFQSKWDLYTKKWSSSLEGMQGEIITPMGAFKFVSPLIGAFNLSNILAATAAAISLKVPLKTIPKTLKEFAQVPGRLERVPNNKGIHAFVDYAHTPDALKKVLQSIRSLDPPKIITVFGCGGDRDRSKRPIMGREVARFSEMAIVTSDNPRTENPNKIIQEILPGIEEGGLTLDKDCLVESDRRKAITKAMTEAKPGEVVLVAGKGHEDYQILGTKKIHFDDREVIRNIFK